MKKLWIFAAVLCICAAVGWWRTGALSRNPRNVAQGTGVLPSGRPDPRKVPAVRRPLPRPGQESSLVNGGPDGAELKFAAGGEELRAVPNGLFALGIRKPPQASKIPLKLGSYALVDDMIAIPRGEFTPAPGLTVVQARGPYVFARLAPDANAPDNARPVALNLSTNGLGVITGGLTVKLQQTSAADALVREYRLKPVQVFESSHAAFFETGKSDVAELTRLLTAIRGDARVVRAELEILENWAVPK